MNLQKQDPASQTDYRTKRPDKVDNCPLCSGLKMKKAKYCRKCKDAQRPYIVQPDDTSINYIPLTHDQFAVVDAYLYDWLNEYRWQAHWNPKTRSYYAVGWVNGQTVKMHRLILGLPLHDPRHGDHERSGETLDNRGCNIRIASDNQNMYNRRMNRNNKSGFKGVYPVPQGKFAAKIKVDGKAIYLGLRDTAQAAHLELYIPAAEKYHGEFARMA